MVELWHIRLLHATIFYEMAGPGVPSWLNHAARCSLSTLRAVVAFDYARLACGRWLAVTASAFAEWVPSEGFSYRLQSIPSSFYGFSLSRFRADPGRPPRTRGQGGIMSIDTVPLMSDPASTASRAAPAETYGHPTSLPRYLGSCGGLGRSSLVPDPSSVTSCDNSLG